MAQLHDTAYIYVGEADRVEQFKGILISNGRDFDILQESLGICVFVRNKFNLYYSMFHFNKNGGFQVLLSRHFSWKVTIISLIAH